jgi:hypothetical protein
MVLPPASLLSGNRKEETTMTDTSIYHVPATVDDMRPPKPSSLIAEAASLLRAHWTELKPYYQSISGEIPSMHGSVQLDEASCVFKIKEVADANGYAYLSSVKTVELRRALRFGFKRNTGVPMRMLEKQYRQLHINGGQ